MWIRTKMYLLKKEDYIIMNLNYSSDFFKVPNIFFKNHRFFSKYIYVEMLYEGIADRGYKKYIFSKKKQIFIVGKKVTRIFSKQCFSNWRK